MMPGDLMSDDDVRDVVVRAPMSFDEARRLTDAAAGMLDDFRQRVIELWQGRGHEALGYKTWPDYVRTEFEMLPRMGRLERRAYILELSAAGMSQREAAATVNVNQTTVGRILVAESEANASLEPPAGAGNEAPATGGDRPPEVWLLTGSPAAPAGPSPEPEPDPNPAAAGVTSGGLAGGDSASDVDGTGEGFVPDRPADDWQEPATPGAVASAVPAGPTDEAPADQDPDAEYRPWRAAATASLRKARKAVYALTGDLLDVDTVAQRADDELLANLESFAEQLRVFLIEVRAQRGPDGQEEVWVAAQRHGSTFHRPDAPADVDLSEVDKTVCGRSTRTGVFLPRRSAEVGGLDGKPCPRCWPKAAS